MAKQYFEQVRLSKAEEIMRTGDIRRRTSRSLLKRINQCQVFEYVFRHSIDSFTRTGDVILSQ
jgi:hypothetical protein